MAKTTKQAKLDRSRPFGRSYGQAMLHGQLIAYEQDGKCFNPSGLEIQEPKPAKAPKQPAAAEPAGDPAPAPRPQASMPDGEDYENWRRPALNVKMKELTGKGIVPGTSNAEAAAQIREAIANAPAAAS